MERSSVTGQDSPGSMARQEISLSFLHHIYESDEVVSHFHFPDAEKTLAIRRVVEEKKTKKTDYD